MLANYSADKIKNREVQTILSPNKWALELLNLLTGAAVRYAGVLTTRGQCRLWPHAGDASTGNRTMMHHNKNSPSSIGRQPVSVQPDTAQT